MPQLCGLFLSVHRIDLETGKRKTVCLTKAIDPLIRIIKIGE